MSAVQKDTLLLGHVAEQVATILLATAGRIANAIKIDPSYSPGGVNVHPL